MGTATQKYYDVLAGASLDVEVRDTYHPDGLSQTRKVSRHAEEARHEAKGRENDRQVCESP